ncbi:hypothetical protein J3454_08445 [Erythrobacter sp. NFXS35]|uniref:hypothetical protein n=1 Tax=Erythrobacter sp. NFXS35 TaxID=2818436 RepID=UPI0032E0571F
MTQRDRWRRSLLAGGAALLTLPLAAPLAANPDPLPVDTDAESAAIGRYQDADQRLQDIGWKLAQGNVGFCPRVIPSIGLQLQDMASYGAPAIARSALGLTRDFAVQTAARGSPAALSGAFARNREIVMLERFDPNQWPTTTPVMNWHRLVWAHDHIEAMLSEHGGIAVGFADGEEARVAPVEVCATRFELMGEGKKAVADGKRVVIGIEFPAFAYPEEDVFAAVIAHELAHNFLEHDAWLDRNRRTRRHVRRTEREADRLMPWLLANAGYDPQAAVTFMTRWGSRHDAGILMIRDHDGWDERAEFIAAELPLIASVLAREGRADWRTHFVREIDPAKGLEAAQSE